MISAGAHGTSVGAADVLGRIRLHGSRLRLAVLLVWAAVLAAHVALFATPDARFDRIALIVDAIVGLFVLLAVVRHINSLTRERQRRALALLLLDLGLEPRGIGETAGRAIDALVAGGLADAGVLALTDEAAAALQPIAAAGYPADWLATAPGLTVPRAGMGVVVERAGEPHPWVDPLISTLGDRPWLAVLPLLSGDQTIGAVLLVARRARTLRQLALLDLVGAPLAAALHHAELYEAAFRRERELEEQAARHREFLAAIAHEVRTPLTSIRAFAELLIAERDRGANTDELAHSLMRGVERLSMLIDDLLELGQVQETDLRIMPTVVDVADALHLAETVLRPAFMLREQTLAMELPDSPSYAIADRRHLEQVLLNLLSNANRHTPECGRIVVRVHEGAPGTIRIEVEDSGPGIDMSDRERIFEPYYRVRRPGVPVVPGSGLGLAVARRLTQLQGGRIWVDEGPNGGACFCVELRAAGAEGARATSAAVATSTEGPASAESVETAASAESLASGEGAASRESAASAESPAPAGGAADAGNPASPATPTDPA